MKVKDGLAAQHWIDNTNRIYDEDLHVSSPVMEAYRAGFEKARELAVELIKGSWTNPRYEGYTFESGLQMMSEDLKQLGEENET